MPELSVRVYQESDREIIRSIAYQTGYIGSEVKWLWSNPKTFADLITNYYLDKEPESSFVAIKDGQVVGYLLGCLDSRKAQGSAAKEIGRIILCGGLFKPGIAPFLWRSAWDILMDHGATDDELIDPRWPAHMHLNLLSEGRNTRLGWMLVKKWFEYLKQNNVPGVHFATFNENKKVIRLAERFGFIKYGPPVLVPGFRMLDSSRMHVQWMVYTL